METVDQPQVVRKSILDEIGHTPILRLTQLTDHLKPKVEVWAKLEMFNPGGSIKDRPALQMILDAEASGLLTPGKVILDSTSGNTGIAYAMIGVVKGYQVELVMPSSVSIERRYVIQSYGAKLILSDPLEGSDGAILMCRDILAADPERYYKPDQYNNPSNPKAHYLHTASEIWEQTQGRVTHFVATLGTSGTLIGTGRRLKELNPDVKIVAIEPPEFHGVEGLKNMDVSIVPGIYDASVWDEKVQVETEDAYDAARRLTRELGLLVGQSCGAAMVGALKVAETLDEGVVVTLFPDSGEKYMSTPLWRLDK
ncbi:MAG: cysteine synthase family protein [Candidatus Latescibacteria bacterium]|nr:cysteine synthase family protein [Candidatus Latescibacterota bacterium]MBT4139027.1 cysteine synthase family protein [Candidatus Latescibacterota bacterium]MBT5829712.1 cysteine synthase family protein [Candidatus Latescibacterota bacterium]